MSYSVNAIGTKEEAHAQVDQQLGGNTSPEIPTVLALFHTLIDSLEGLDKRIHLVASGWHSGGLVSHTLNITSAIVPPAEGSNGGAG